MGEGAFVQGKTIRVTQGMTLVEWYDKDHEIHRHWVTPEMIRSQDSQSVIVDRPGRGIPYGDDLLVGFEPQFSVDVLQRELHEHNIWLYADVLAAPNAVRSALLSAYGIDLAPILRTASQMVKGK